MNRSAFHESCYTKYYITDNWYTVPVLLLQIYLHVANKILPLFYSRVIFLFAGHFDIYEDNYSTVLL